jgi:hypothetical protein
MLLMKDQFVKPLWPFFVASGLTFFGVAKLQSAALQCGCTPP